MSRRWITPVALAAALVFTSGRTMSAQDGPRMANGKPDFSGMYTPPSTVKATGPRGNLIFNADKMAPVKPGAESLLYRPRTGDARLDEPRAMCLPAGFPSGMLYILPIQIVQNPRHIVITPELQRASRIIPTDGRAHRTGIEPSYYGDSVGRWDGDTLIIETRNINGWAKIDTIGHPISNQAKIIQTYKRVNFGTIEHTSLSTIPRPTPNPGRSPRPGRKKNGARL